MKVLSMDKKCSTHGYGTLITVDPILPLVSVLWQWYSSDLYTSCTGDLFIVTGQVNTNTVQTVLQHENTFVFFIPDHIAGS